MRQTRDGIALDAEPLAEAYAWAAEWDIEFADDRPSLALRRLADELRAESAKAAADADNLRTESAKAAADAEKMAADAATAQAWAEELEVEP